MQSGKVLERAQRPLLKALREAEEEITLASPFISERTADEIARAALVSNATSFRLLTALNRAPVRAGYLSAKGLQLLAGAGFEIRSARNLHAKFLIVDRGFGILGSGNLTTQGLGGERRRNLELGVSLTESQARSSRKIFQSWWRRSEPVDAERLAYYASLPPAPHGGRVTDGGDGAWVFGDDKDMRKLRPGGTGYWLKMLYHHTRRDRKDWWRKVTWISDGRPPPSPTHLVGGPRYAVDDLLVFYLVELDGQIRCCPALARVKSTPGYNPDFVKTNGAKDDHLRWPWVTEVEILDSTGLDQAPELADIEVSPSSTERKGRIKLNVGQYAAARSHIAANP